MTSPSRIDKILLFVFIVVAAIVASKIFNNPYNDQSFDQGSWNTAGCWPNYDCPRGPMVQDLINKYLQPGSSREQVESLIGKGDVPERQCGGRSDCYWLGNWRGLFMREPGFMIVRYTDSDFVSLVELTK